MLLFSLSFLLVRPFPTLTSPDIENECVMREGIRLLLWPSSSCAVCVRTQKHEGHNDLSFLVHDRQIERGRIEC